MSERARHIRNKAEEAMAETMQLFLLWCGNPRITIGYANLANRGPGSAARSRPFSPDRVSGRAEIVFPWQG